MPTQPSLISSRAARKILLSAGALSSALLAMIGVMSSAAAVEDDQDGRDRLEDPVIYLEGNIALPGGNIIIAYRLTRDGAWRPLANSPYPTHGTGVIDPSLALGPFDADQQIITNAERTLLFAVNSGSNTIAVFHILADGSLADVEGSPFPSGGSDPVSFGLSGDTLVVVNKAMDPKQADGLTPNYTSFRVLTDGTLLPAPLSKVDVAIGNSPSQALISPSKRFVFGADFLGGLLQSFQLSPTGDLEQHLPQPLPAFVFAGSTAPHLPLGLAAHPSRPVVYVGLVTINRVAVYEYDLTGKLSFLRTVADSGAGPCWIITNAVGTRIYVSDTTDNAVSVYDTSDPENPVQIQKLILKGEGSSFELALEAKGHWLFALSQRAAATTPLNHGNVLHALRVDRDGRLEESADPKDLTLPTGTRPQGLATF